MRTHELFTTKDPALIEREIAAMMAKAARQPKAETRRQIYKAIIVLIEWLMMLEEEG